MQEIFTQNQVLKTLYQETEPSQSRKLFAALKEDISLKEAFDSYNDIIVKLDSVSKPSACRTSLDIIKYYSLKTAK